jgi:hypothetical protein
MGGWTTEREPAAQHRPVGDHAACAGKAQGVKFTPELDAIVTAGVPALLQIGHVGGEQTAAPRLGTLRDCIGA